MTDAPTPLSDEALREREQLLDAIHEALGGNGWAYANYGNDERNSQRDRLEAVADLLSTLSLRSERADVIEECARVADAEELTGDPPADFSEREIFIVQGAVQATAKSIAAAIRAIPSSPRGDERS